jgi:hypothetical protein
VPAGYLLAIVGGGIVIGAELGWPARVRVPLVLGAMHLSWGIGFLTSPRRLEHHSGAVAASPEAAR